MYQPAASGVKRTSRALPFCLIFGVVSFSHPSRMTVATICRRSTDPAFPMGVIVKTTSWPSV